MTKTSKGLIPTAMKSRHQIPYETAIIGGGPAGLSAALWCSELGLRTLLIEQRKSIGGQLLSIRNPISNYLGRQAANGAELLEHFDRHVKASEFERRLGLSVVEADLTAKAIRLSDDSVVFAKTIVIATGVRRRRLNVDGEKEYEGRGVMASGVGEKASVCGKTVMIVGGGDAALENALILSDLAKKVVVVHRGGQFSAHARFVEALRQRTNIVCRFDTVVTAIAGDEKVEAASLLGKLGRKEIRVPVDAVLVRIGVEPNSEVYLGQVETDERGYIRVDNCGVTTRQGVYAIGDIANPNSPTISTAVGNGATVGKLIQRELAVGYPIN